MAARQDTRSLEDQSVGLGAGTSGREARNAVTSKEDSIIKTSVKERALHKDECLSTQSQQSLLFHQQSCISPFDLKARRNRRWQEGGN